VTHALPVQSSTFSNCSADASGLSTALGDATGEGCQEFMGGGLLREVQLS
jgi:hypothetical protein